MRLYNPNKSATLTQLLDEKAEWNYAAKESLKSKNKQSEMISCVFHLASFFFFFHHIFDVGTNKNSE